MAADLESRRDFTAAGAALVRAWGLLRPFGTVLARSATSILVFRLDGFDLLADPTYGSSLRSVAGYFQSPPRLGSPEPPEATDSGIWIDRFQESVIGATRELLAGHGSEALGHLAEAPDGLRAAAGNERKHLVLTARANMAIGRPDVARRAYGQLEFDQWYGQEAKEAIR